MPSPILARADALMHRKRPSDADLDDVPLLTDAIGDDDDIPVLLEAEPLPPAPVVESFAPVSAPPSEPSAQAEMESAPTDIAAPATILEAELRERLAAELARRVEQRLAAELPRVIEATVRDFLAEQDMIAAAPHN